MQFSRILLLVASILILSNGKAQQNEIQWLSFEEAILMNEKEPKKFLIDIYTSWCGWCKKMDATTFKDPLIVSYIQEHYWAVKLNAERKDTVLLGQQMFINENPGGKRHPHQLAVALLNGKMSYPSIVYLDENVEMLSPVPGYHDARGIEPILKYFGENAYKNASWEEYQKNFNSSYTDKVE
jgi:thioredoxin-related protein